MTFDHQIRQVLERALTDLRAHIEADLGRFAQDLMRVAGEERHRATVAAAEFAAADIRHQADAQVFELRKGFQQQLEEVRRTAQQQTEVAQQQLADARQATQPQLEEMCRALTAELEETRRQLDAQVEEARRLARAEIEQARVELDATKRAAQMEAEAVASAQLAVAQAEAERTTAQAVERARIDAGQAELAAAARLVEAIRSLDDAGSLGGVLDGLADCAAREVDRAAVMILKGERLRGWRFVGFVDAGSPTSMDLNLDAAGLPGVVVRTGVTVSRSIPGGDPEEDTRQPGLPPFAGGSGARHATALPVLVAGHVVAVLYADAPQVETPSSASRWPAVLEVLVRHASRVLEAMTVQQATGLSPGRQVARASHAAVAGPVEGGESGDLDAARRYARLLVSEIRMHHEPLVDAGRRSRDLRLRLGGEIDRARRLYEARVPPAVRAQSDYFEQELVRTLADGDRTLLG